VLQRVIQYGQGVAGAFTAILPTLQALPGVGGSSVLSTLVSVVGEAVKVLPTVASIAGAANPISAIFGALPQIAALVGSVGNLPPNVQMWINATASLAQVVGPLVGLALTLAAPAPGVVMAAPTAHPDEQVAYLQLLALQRR
jgi:hypothetical protein